MHTVSSYTRKKKLLVIIIGMIIKKERKEANKERKYSKFVHVFFLLNLTFYIDSNSSIRFFVLPCRIIFNVLYLSRPEATFC